MDNFTDVYKEILNEFTIDTRHGSDNSMAAFESGKESQRVGISRKPEKDADFRVILRQDPSNKNKFTKAWLAGWDEAKKGK